MTRRFFDDMTGGRFTPKFDPEESLTVLAANISELLLKIIEVNPLKTASKDYYTGISRPITSVHDYLTRLMTHLTDRKSNWILMLIYLSRYLQAYPEKHLNDLNVHRLMVACILRTLVERLQLPARLSYHSFFQAFPKISVIVGLADVDLWDLQQTFFKEFNARCEARVTDMEYAECLQYVLPVVAKKPLTFFVATKARDQLSETIAKKAREVPPNTDVRTPLADLLVKAIELNRGKPLSVDLYTCNQPPKMSIKNYISRISQCFILVDTLNQFRDNEPVIYVMAWVYLSKYLEKNPHKFLNDCNVHCYLLCCVLLAQKIAFDRPPVSNERMSEIGGVTPEVLNEMEKTFLIELDYEGFISIQDYNTALQLVLSHQAAHSAPSMAC